jgi:hypothetical protein
MFKENMLQPAIGIKSLKFNNFYMLKFINVIKIPATRRAAILLQQARCNSPYPLLILFRRAFNCW